VPNPIQVAYIATDHSISVTLNGRFRCLKLNTEQGTKLHEACKKRPQDIDEIAMLADVTLFIAKHTFGRVQVDENDQLRLDGKVIDYGLSSIILRMVNEGDDVSHLVRFVENVAENPDPEIAEHVYSFLHKGLMPITPDGCFHAFKKVDNDYKSFACGSENVEVTVWEDDILQGGFQHTFVTLGHIPYPVGGTLTMDRTLCDPKRNKTCSVGLHACSPGYLNHWYGMQGRLLIVKINPRDVTAVPNDYNDAKLRCCRLEVLAEIPEEDAVTHFDRAVEHRYTPGWEDRKIEEPKPTLTIHGETYPVEEITLTTGNTLCPTPPLPPTMITGEIIPNLSIAPPETLDQVMQIAVEDGHTDASLDGEFWCDPLTGDSYRWIPKGFREAYCMMYSAAYCDGFVLEDHTPRAYRRGVKDGKTQARADVGNDTFFRIDPGLGLHWLQWGKAEACDADAYCKGFYEGYFEILDALLD